MNLNIVDDLRKINKSGCASPSPAAAPVAWVAMASGTGAGGCNSQGQRDPDPRGFYDAESFPFISRLSPVYFRLSWTPVYSVYPRHLARKRRFPQPCLAGSGTNTTPLPLNACPLKGM